MENETLANMKGKEKTAGQMSFFLGLLEQRKIEREDIEAAAGLPMEKWDRYVISVVINVMKASDSKDVILFNIKKELNEPQNPKQESRTDEKQENKEKPTEKHAEMKKDKSTATTMADMGLPPDFPKRFLMDYMGRPYVMVAGLQWLADRKGFQAIETIDKKLEDGSWEANVSVFPILNPEIMQSVALLCPEAQKEAIAYLCKPTNGIGTGSKSNVKSQMQPFLREMAQTRALGRALKKYVRYGDTAYEELSDANLEVEK